MCIYVWWMLQSECHLVQCREQTMEEEVAVTMFGTDKYGPAVKQGQMTGYHCFHIQTRMALLRACIPNSNKAKQNTVVLGALGKQLIRVETREFV